MPYRLVNENIGFESAQTFESAIQAVEQAIAYDW
jgi:hypothetical protein